MIVIFPPTNPHLIQAAAALAGYAHGTVNQKRKYTNEPYIVHPMEVAEIVASVTNDSEMIAAAWLHDVVEDTGVTLQEIEERFGARVRELVASETEDKRADLPPADTWRVRKEESLAALKNTEDTDVLTLWLGDKLSNMRSFYRTFKERGDAMWQSFNQKDPSEQAWYYRSIVKLTERLSDTSAWLEYKTLTELVFGREE